MDKQQKTMSQEEFAKIAEDETKNVEYIVEHLDPAVLHHASEPKAVCMSFLHRWFPSTIVGEYECDTEDVIGIEGWNRWVNIEGRIEKEWLFNDFKTYMLSIDTGILVNLIICPYSEYVKVRLERDHYFSLCVDSGLIPEDE